VAIVLFALAMQLGSIAQTGSGSIQAIATQEKPRRKTGLEVAVTTLFLGFQDDFASEAAADDVSVGSSVHVSGLNFGRSPKELLT
jgi:hypothetical protein